MAVVLMCGKKRSLAIQPPPDTVEGLASKVSEQNVHTRKSHLANR